MGWDARKHHFWHFKAVIRSTCVPAQSEWLESPGAQAQLDANGPIVVFWRRSPFVSPVSWSYNDLQPCATIKLHSRISNTYSNARFCRSFVICTQQGFSLCSYWRQHKGLWEEVDGWWVHFNFFYNITFVSILWPDLTWRRCFEFIMRIWPAWTLQLNAIKLVLR